MYSMQPTSSLRCAGKRRFRLAGPRGEGCAHLVVALLPVAAAQEGRHVDVVLEAARLLLVDRRRARRRHVQSTRLRLGSPLVAKARASGAKLAEARRDDG